MLSERNRGWCAALALVAAVTVGGSPRLAWAQAGSTHGEKAEAGPKRQTNKDLFADQINAVAAADEDGAIAEFRKVWAKRSPVFRSQFLGVHTVQNPMDAWVAMELIYETRPDLIVEAGTYRGGSAALWAMVLDQVNPDGRVITIDIEDRRDEKAKALEITQRKVTFLLGSSTSPEIVSEVQKRAEGKRVLVILDSLHTADHVRDELAAYAPLVPVGGYVIVQDTPVGPIEGIRRFIAKDSRFVPDRSKERFIIQNTISGYLRRVR